MQINEFVKRIVNEYPYRLQTKKQIDYFRENCIAELWIYQGDTLAAAWKEILRTHDKTSHPKMPYLLDVCKKTKIRGNEERETNMPATDESLKLRKLMEEFKKSETFIKCCEARIAHTALIYISQNNELPSGENLREMAKKAKELDRQFQEWDNNPNLSIMEKIMYKTAKAMRETNQEYYDEYVTNKGIDT